MKHSVFYSLLIILVILIISLFVTLKAKAVDLGVWGDTSPIKEDDLQEYIISKLESLDKDKLKEYQESIANQTIQNIKKPKAVKGISKVTHYSQRSFDPTFILNEDIYIEPGKLLYAKGTKLNPLDYKEFDEVWIIIDGDDLAQVNLAKNYNHEGNKHKKVILINGNPGMQVDGSFFYFDQAGEISNKLNVTKVPSIISQINGRKDISIEEIAIDEDGVIKNDKAF